MSRYFWQNHRTVFLICCRRRVLNVVMFYRRIKAIGRLTVCLWTGTLLTTVSVIVSGPCISIPSSRSISLPMHSIPMGFVLGLGAAFRVAMYDYLGYYDICYIGEEVRDPERVIPRSFCRHGGGRGHLSGRQPIDHRRRAMAGVDPAESHRVRVHRLDFMERIYGSKVASVFTVMILWTAFGSVFALMLGYCRIPFAAARDGYFFSIFGHLHPTKQFPHISVVVLGAIAVLCSFLPLGFVIDALITTRIIVQFIGQVVSYMLLRAKHPEMPRPFRMWLYPLPTIIALAGWIFLLLTSGWQLIALGIGTLALGVVCFFNLVVAH